MSRPKDADSARTYERIVRAALDLLRGIDEPDQLSMRKVAAAADVSVGTVQYYFGSKSDLLEACLDGHYERLEAVARELAPAISELEPGEVVPHVARAVYRWLQSERSLIRLRFATNARRGELHPRRQPELRSSMDAAARVLAPYIDADPPTARLAMLSLSAVAHRLVLLTDAELETLTERRGDAMRAAAEDYFVRAAVALLGAP